jgi:hypothetical protein
MFTQSDLNTQQRPRLELLSEYDFEITDIKGMVKKVADALGQRPRIFLVISLKTNLQENILTL